MRDLSNHLETIKNKLKESSKLNELLNITQEDYEALLEEARSSILFEHDNFDDFLATAILHSASLYQILDMMYGFNEVFED